MVRHDFAGAPQIIQSQGAVFAAAIALRACARRRLEVAVIQDAALAQQPPHFFDGLGVLEAHFSNARVVVDPVIDPAVALTVHDRPPVGQLVHRPGSQPAAPIEELALLVGDLLPQAGRGFEHAAVQGDVLAAGDDLQRVELQVFHGAHGLLDARQAAPAPPRPQALPAEDIATGGFDVDGQHGLSILLHR